MRLFERVAAALGFRNMRTMEFVVTTLAPGGINREAPDYWNTNPKPDQKEKTMNDYEMRETAMKLAVQSGGKAIGCDVVAEAQAILNFLRGGDQPEEAKKPGYEAFTWAVSGGTDFQKGEDNGRDPMPSHDILSPDLLSNLMSAALGHRPLLIGELTARKILGALGVI